MRVHLGHDHATNPMLIFWATAFAIALLVLVTLARGRAPHQGARDIDVYRAQLAEVDRDLARGTLPEAEASRLRTEIGRRILAADQVAPDVERSSGHLPWRSIALTLFVVPALLYAGPAYVLHQMGFEAAQIEKWRNASRLSLPVGDTTLTLTPLFYGLGAPGHGDLALADRVAYAEEIRQNRPSQAAAQASLPVPELPADISALDRDLLNKLRDLTATRPKDARGFDLLAQTEAKFGMFPAAARAQAALIGIKGEDASVDDLALLGQFYVLAAGGYVSPEAETTLRAALARDPGNGTARYYLGLMLVQTGRPDLAFRIWDRQLREGPPEAPWIAPIMGQITQTARAAGIAYELPEVGEGTAGPSTDDIAAAAELTPQERLEMIGGMVSGLSDRLAREGGPPTDWARLITSLGVLGDTDQAAAIYQNAIEVFGDDPAALDIITRAGEQAGVAG